MLCRRCGDVLRGTRGSAAVRVKHTRPNAETRWRVLQVVGLLLSAAWCCLGDIVIPLTTVGVPDNAADDTGHGSVAYTYQISTYEISVSQYTEFLNAKAGSDPYGLYDDSMGTGGGAGDGYIVQTGTEGEYSYNAVSGKEGQPIRHVSWYDTLRFCNWLHNGQGDGDTETGSYDMSAGANALRVLNATWALPLEDEWYKAAYYDPVGDLYYDYPNGTDAVPTEPSDQTTPRAMNFGDVPFWQGGVYYTSAGETLGASPNGTYDQGGNVAEWLETRSLAFPDHLIRGGAFLDHEGALGANSTDAAEPTMDGAGFGFRVVYLIPEPTAAVLMLSGLALLMFAHRTR